MVPSSLKVRSDDPTHNGEGGSLFKPGRVRRPCNSRASSLSSPPSFRRASEGSHDWISIAPRDFNLKVPPGRPQESGGFQFREAFGDAAAGTAALRSAVQPPLQYGDLLCSLAELPVDDGCLLGVPGRGFTALARGHPTVGSPSTTAAAPTAALRAPSAWWRSM
jgi:hypothetical protein